MAAELTVSLQAVTLKFIFDTPVASTNDEESRIHLISWITKVTRLFSLYKKGQSFFLLLGSKNNAFKKPQCYRFVVLRIQGQ